MRHTRFFFHFKEDTDVFLGLLALFGEKWAFEEWVADRGQGTRRPAPKLVQRQHCGMFSTTVPLIVCQAQARAKASTCFTMLRTTLHIIGKTYTTTFMF